ncbi:hypothetical protein [Pseudomonas sp. HMWF021]|jgi:rRNA maturation endonuclease Nob1|uniref:hypothetical protein n=1 Tax=Pseudomonas sp. HMWF021 TaxID=2056857 RepID=UPI000D36B6A5|nr:hypothetical protein [Pseudomonas sp. HMWF021]PTT24511.1 hypothetical protein DBR18_27360 [Pseudomonas sp. HMWF021]
MEEVLLSGGPVKKVARNGLDSPSQGIETLKSSSVSGGSGLSEEADGQSASMVQSNVMSFFAGLSKDDKLFVKDSIKYAEAQADARTNRKRHPADWFGYYTGGLWSIGWVPEGDPVEKIDKQYRGSLMDAWVAVMKSNLSAARLKASLEAASMIESHPDTSEIFNGSIRKDGDMRVLPIAITDDKRIELWVSDMRLIVSSWSTDYLFWKVQQTLSQLDIRARRFTIGRRDMDAKRAELRQAVEQLDAIEFNFPV